MNLRKPLVKGSDEAKLLDDIVLFDSESVKFQRIGKEENDTYEAENVFVNDSYVGHEAHSGQLVEVTYRLPVNSERMVGEEPYRRALRTIVPSDERILEATVAIQPVRDNSMSESSLVLPQIVGILTPSSKVLRYDGSGQIKQMTRLASVSDVLSHLYSDDETIKHPDSGTEVPIWHFAAGTPNALSFNTNAEASSADHYSFRNTVREVAKHLPSYANGIERMPRHG